MTARITFLKNELKPWRVKEWCVPASSAEYVAHMEDVLETYKLPYDALRPVVCLDEASRQLIEVRHIPVAESGQVELVDYEYRKCRVVNLFTMFEALSSNRFVEVTDTRIKVDFAQCIKNW